MQNAVAIGSVLLVALLWLVALAELRAQEARTIEAAIRENRNRAAAFEQYVVRTLETANVAAAYVAERFADQLGGAAPRRAASLADPVTRNQLFAGVIVADRHGEVRVTTLPSAPRLNLASSAAFRRFRADPSDNGPFVSRPALTPFSERPVIPFVRPIRRGDGSFAGIVIVQIIAERLVDFNRGATNRPLDLISVIRSDGISLARRKGQQVSFGEDLRETRVMREQAANPDGTYLGPSALDGIRRLFSHRRLDEHGIFVTVGVGESDVMMDIRNRNRLVVAGLAALMLAILAFALSAVLGMRRREAAARALEIANLRLREAQKIARIGDWEYDPRTGAVRLSDELRGTYGLAPAGGARRDEEIAALFRPAQRKIWRDAVRRAIAERTPQECELEAELPGGLSCRRITIVPRFGLDGAVDKVVGTDQDITREKEHGRLRDQVAHSARVEVLNAMSATIAHELAQPLTAASNYLASARMFARRRPPGFEDRIAETLDHVDRQIGVTRTIVRRVWEMVAHRRSSVQRASLADAVHDAVGLVKLANPHPKVEIVQRLAPEAQFVCADKVQIQQVLINLLGNAAEGASKAARPLVIVSTRRLGDCVQVSVSDNGTGIPADSGDVFCPFASTKNGGLGLGLSISRMIVESFGGKIWVDANSERGVRLCFSLPAAEAAAEA